MSLIVHLSECGCCCQYHLPRYLGECRDDSQRFPMDRIEMGVDWHIGLIVKPVAPGHVDYGSQIWVLKPGDGDEADPDLSVKNLAALGRFLMFPMADPRDLPLLRGTELHHLGGPMWSSYARSKVEEAIKNHVGRQVIEMLARREYHSSCSYMWARYANDPFNFEFPPEYEETGGGEDDAELRDEDPLVDPATGRAYRAIDLSGFYQDHPV